ncbi:hypothetical protein BH24ACT11_BH24ACT11_00220 [soil metagenome]
MIGYARTLAVDVPLPEGVTVRRVTEEADVRAMSAMQDEVFGDPASGQMANDSCVDCPLMTEWSCEPRRGGGLSAPVGWSQCAGLSLQGSGAARPSRSGEVAESTAR